MYRTCTICVLALQHYDLTLLINAHLVICTSTNKSKYRLWMYSIIDDLTDPAVWYQNEPCMTGRRSSQVRQEDPWAWLHRINCTDGKRSFFFQSSRHAHCPQFFPQSFPHRDPRHLIHKQYRFPPESPGSVTCSDSFPQIDSTKNLGSFIGPVIFRKSTTVPACHSCSAGVPWSRYQVRSGS